MKARMWYNKKQTIYSLGGGGYMQRVFVGMSGGVDSSVTAALLKSQGYDTVGVTLRLKPGDAAQTDIEDARRVAETIGIEHRVLDLREIFKEKVIDYFTAEYLRGATPNPCVMCNKDIKFGAMLDYALENGANLVATGHYASLVKTPSGAVLRRSESKKDQSYFLCMLSQFQLSHALFPLDGMEKSRIRELAAQFNLNVAQKKDSQEVCFIPDDDYAAFIRSHGLCDSGEGDFLDTDGNVIGRHRGIMNYTVGQRKGLGAFGRPMFVTRIVPEKNAVVLGENGTQYLSSFTATDLNIISPHFKNSIDCEVKIRFRAPAAPAHIELQPDGTAQVTFSEPQRSVTPGQFAAFYLDGEVLGGGKIG